MEQSTLLTNERVIQLTIALIGLLGSLILVLAAGMLGLGRYIFKKVMGEIHTYKEESMAQRSEFNHALENKFKSINFYMKLTDRLQVNHEASINGFKEHAQEVKAKLMSHEEKINRHGEKLASHTIEIENLKKNK